MISFLHSRKISITGIIKKDGGMKYFVISFIFISFMISIFAQEAIPEAPGSIAQAPETITPQQIDQAPIQQQTQTTQPTTPIQEPSIATPPSVQPVTLETPSTAAPQQQIPKTLDTTQQPIQQQPIPTTAAIAPEQFTWPDAITLTEDQGKAPMQTPETIEQFKQAVSIIDQISSIIDNLVKMRADFYQKYFDLDATLDEFFQDISIKKGSLSIKNSNALE